MVRKESSRIPAPLVVQPAGLPDLPTQLDTPRAYRTSEAARLVNLHPSTIRRFDKLGLVRPRRTWTGHRRYSTADLARLRELAGLPPDDSEAGIQPAISMPRVPS